MPGLEKIHLEDAWEDNPQTRSLVALFEQDGRTLKKYIESLYDHCEQVLNAQRELADATNNLSRHLRIYEDQSFPLDTDPDSVLRSTLRQISSMLDEVSSWQQMCATQMADGMMFPLSRFIDADLTEIFTMGEMFHASCNELKQAVGKFCKVPQRRDNEKQRQDTRDDVYTTSKKFHKMALHYYASLNALQYKRKIALIEPLLGYLHSLKSHFAVGYEALNTPEVESFLSNISTSVQGVQAELGQETQKTVELIESIEKQSQHLYYAELPVDLPYIPPNTGLSQKSGYLFQRTKFAGMVTKWEQIYFYTVGGYLMSISKDEVAGSSVMELDIKVAAQALEQEDRRNVFQISNGKKVVILQAINERERDEWIATINNIAKESHSCQEYPKPVKQLSKDRNSQKSVEKSERSSNYTPSPTSSEAGEKSSFYSSQPSSPMGHLLPDIPIQFDMFSPSDNTRDEQENSKDGTSVSNPYDQSPTSVTTEGSTNSTNTFWEVFAVRFLGSMQVPNDRGENLIFETMRQIMTARAIHGVFKMSESHMVISNSCLKIVDPSHQAIKATFSLEDISFWTGHKDNNRLIGFITRSKSDCESPPTFHCYIFEAHLNAQEICNALSTAANIALKKLLENKNKENIPEASMENLSIADNPSEEQPTKTLEHKQESQSNVIATEDSPSAGNENKVVEA
ncbi:DCC-interacting protein 13-alpha-like isoform X1 [Centruroides sculpturatus]|uniref:DCC-interacting protein 13-alpha-like isoform X1 n=1 Tax=Centruroides sculpturatus TaxID=218467 RepID=UPI000C6E7085|nr:DCC-interacting protein 13-alpha-like isoform X1 [Centruroides sculpturatus]